MTGVQTCALPICGAQAVDEGLGTPQDVRCDGRLDGWRSRDRHAVERGAKTVEVDAPAAVAPRRARDVAHRIEQVDVADADLRAAAQMLPGEGLPEAARDPDVLAVGRALDLRQEPGRLNRLDRLDEKLQVHALVLESEQQVVERIVAGRRHRGRHRQQAIGGHDPRYWPDGGRTRHLEPGQAQRATKKLIADGVHAFSRESMVFLRTNSLQRFFVAHRLAQQECMPDPFAGDAIPGVASATDAKRSCDRVTIGRLRCRHRNALRY